MCRLAGYVGHEPIPLSALLYDPPHSLERAAYSPRELLQGTINVDGTGVAWWPKQEGPPLRYISTQPPWSDPNLPGLAPALCGSTVLAAVRSATPGLPHGPGNVAPFISGDLAGVHNGWIGGFRVGIGRQLLTGLSDERFGRLIAMNDSLAIFLLVDQELDDHPGSTVAEALSGVLGKMAGVVRAAGRQAALNIAIARAGELTVVRTSVDADVNSMYTRVDDAGSWVASEPLDADGGWSAMPDHSIARLSRSGVSVGLLEYDGLSS